LQNRARRWQRAFISVYWMGPPSPEPVLPTKQRRNGIRMTRMMRMCLIAVVVALAGLSCVKKEPPQVENFSFTPPDGAVVTHIDLDLTVDFERQRLHGTASFDIDNEAGADKLYLDTWALLIDSVNLGDLGAQTDWTLGDSLALLGRPLIIDIKPGTRRVSVHYRTGEDARGLQWLRPEQTGDGKHPFLYTQSQAILARTWVPCQDHPAARITYRARIHTPPELIALMSARNPREKNPDGEYTFEMPQPIPTYLLALAVGDLAYGAVSDRCGVYASPAMLERALWEFNDMERMAQVAEELYGPYRWEQFDVLVLPPSFPYGGMENPRLTFATPILVAGDRSLVSTIAHELAHSWSGNLVTNATWNDFWLNEGFTTYFTQRIMEELYGREVSEMHAMLGRERLEQAIEEAGPDKLTTALYVPLGDSDPDEELGTAAYQKGYLFLRLLEESFGRERFDAFLAEYFDTFAFETMTTEAFL
ncbi:MAG: aminopeptidase, partial [Candidatus Krumholzibacteriota bacterium]|nr:aminopeptidase [Candidatus Krumholzibacteriota bacterium]